MFSIYISASALADTYLQESDKPFTEQSDWFKILRKQTEIFTYGYVPVDDDFEDGFSVSDILENLGRSYGILIKPADDYISQVLDNNQKVLDHPNAAFFLDIEAEKAQDIQSQYGVICQATDSIDSKVFTKSCIGTNLVKDQETKKGWESILKIPTELPSNSLCIVDRFLFAEDGKNKFGYNTIGFDNISLILYYALPNSFNDEYHITIITDRNNIKSGIIFQTMSDKLIHLVNILAEKKGYPIKLEFLAIDVNNKATKYTQPFIHNRQIFSNYYHINFPNGVNILYFKGGKSFAKYNQFIKGTLLYNDSLDYIESDPIISVIESYRKRFKEIIIDWKAGKDVGYYSYADNRGNLGIKNLELTHFS